MMERRGKSGGMLSIASFLLDDDREKARTLNLRVASAFWREAAKEGLQSLYADAEETLKHYSDKGFDIVEYMNGLKNKKVLWVRARAIDADTVNANGDYFSKEELLKKITVKGKEVPAYKTFEGVPIFTNHKNDDIEEAKGTVVFADWDEEEECVYCTFFIDEEAYPEIANGIRMGYMKDVSMGCQVEAGICSVKSCRHRAETEKDYCKHMKEYKGKRMPGQEEKVYEENLGLKFIELSVVNDGAFETCEIEEIYDVDEILDEALTLEKRAQNLGATIMAAASFLPTDRASRSILENCLRQAQSLTSATLRVAQTAGTLVGGQIMAQEGADQNATVSSILQFLGIDAKAGLNVLDMMNLALNFLEVGVLTLFARKDNVDLSHVGKVTKAMADLQACMQDMIDDGVGNNGGSGAGTGSGNQPLNQGNLQPGQQGGAQGAPPNGVPMQPGAGGPATQPEYLPLSVGRMIAPHIQNTGLPLPGASGAFASTEKPLFVWASQDRDAPREVFASRNASPKQSATIRVMDSLLNLGQALGLKQGPEFKSTRAANGHAQPTKTSSSATKTEQASGGIDSMEHLKKFAAERRKAEMAEASLDLKVADKAGNTVVLSSTGELSAYHNGQHIEWDTTISNEQYDLFESGNGLVVAKQLLDSFGRMVAAAKKDGTKLRVANWHPHLDSKVREDELEEKRTGTYDKVQELLLNSEEAGEYAHIHNPGDVVREELLESADAKEYKRGEHPDLANKGYTREQMLGEDAGLYGRQFSDDKVKDLLLEDARHGFPDEIIQNQLDAVRKDYGPGNPNLVVQSAVQALGRATVAAKVAPEEIVEAVSRLANRADAATLIALASMGTAHRRKIARAKNFHDGQALLSPTASVLNELGAVVTDTHKTEGQITAKDLALSIKSAAKKADRVVEAVTRAAKSLLGRNVEAAKVDTRLSRQEEYDAAFDTEVERTAGTEFNRHHLRVAFDALAQAAQETKSEPEEVVAALAEYDAPTLLAALQSARTATAQKARLTQRKRNAYYGTRTASSEDVSAAVVGWLADYATASEYKSSSMVEAAQRIASNIEVAEALVSRLVQANLNPAQERTAGVTITDTKTTTKRIECTAGELGIDPSAEDFDTQIRDKMVGLLQSKGYQIDPATFALTDVSLSKDGLITAAVTSNVSKTLEASVPTDSNGMGAIDGGGIGGGQPSPAGGPTPDVMPDVPMDSSSPDAAPEMGPASDDASADQGATQDQPEMIQTAGARKLRIAKRQAILARYAQAAGMPGMPAGGGMPGGGMDAGGGAMPDMGMGLGALTVPTAAGAPGEDPADADAMSEPGEKKPWGSICPRCGSKDVDVANGKGNCNSCNAQLEFSYDVKVLPESEKKDNKDADAAGAPPPPGLGPDTGLGAATAPAPPPGGATGGAGAPGGAPPGGAMASKSVPQMVRTSYLDDPDVYLRVAEAMKEAQENDTVFNPNTIKRLPVGMICPTCGNREARKLADRTHCMECGTICLSTIKQSKTHPNKLVVSIKTII